MTGRVRQRLLEDAVRRLVDARSERPPRAGRGELDGEAGRAVALDQGREAGQAERRLDVPAVLRRQVALAKRADELVDLGQGLPRDLLDRLERRPRALRVALAEQPGRACLDEDDVDRVTGRVVQVARDPRPLLGRRQPALALGIPLRPLGAGDELGDPLAPQADAVAEHPGAAPDDDAEEERHGREGIFRVADRADVHHEESRDRRGCHPGARAGSLRRQREQEERGGRAEGRPADIAHTVEYRARGGGGDEDREWRAPPTEERERRSSGQHDPQQVDVAHIGVVVRAARRHQRQGQRKGGGGDRRVDEPFTARHESRVTTRSRRRVSLRRMRSPPSGGRHFRP